MARGLTVPVWVWVVLAIVGVGFAANYMGLVSLNVADTGTGTGLGDTNDKKVSLVDFTGVCDTNNQKAIGFSPRNSLNPTAEYSGGTVRIYKIVDGKEQLFTTAVANTPASVATVNLDCGSAYTYYVAGNATYNSFRQTVDLSSIDAVRKVQRIQEFSYPMDHAVLVFRAYDNAEGAWVYELASSATTTQAATAEVDSGSAFYSTTSNQSLKAVGTGGNVNYKIEFKTNGTAATDTQFNDQALVIAIDLNTTEYNKDTATLTVNGGTATRKDCGLFNSGAGSTSRLVNDNYDVCWEVSGVNANAGVTQTANFYIQAVSGVNPAGNITMAFGTSGYYVDSTGSNMLLGYNTNAASPAYVYALQTIIIGLS